MATSLHCEIFNAYDKKSLAFSFFEEYIRAGSGT